MIDGIIAANYTDHPYLVTKIIPKTYTLVISLLFQANKSRPLSSKFRFPLLINFLWQTGARVTEALSVKVSDIDFYSKVVRMPSFKKRDPQVKTIPKREIHELIDILTKIEEKDKIREQLVNELSSKIKLFYDFLIHHIDMEESTFSDGFGGYERSRAFLFLWNN